ncbi:MAG: Bax inhibitor-1 family protein [Opitutales bacterium]
MNTTNMTKSVSEASTRGTFIKKTYMHLALALMGFALLEYFLLGLPQMAELAGKMYEGYNYLIVMGLFMFVSYIANKWALNSESASMQYAGLSLFVVAEAVICAPLLLIANALVPEAIPQAAYLTLAMFLGLTAIVLFTGKDFSFLRSILIMCSFLALGLIVCSIIFGFQLGLLFTGAMIIFASFSIIYQTSAILHEYNENQYVAASLGIFASVILLFWYILQFLIRRD